MADNRNVDHRDYTHPQGPMQGDAKGPGSTTWLIGAIVAIAAVIGIWYSLGTDTPRTASNTTGTQSTVNSPTPQPPLERQSPAGTQPQNQTPPASQAPAAR